MKRRNFLKILGLGAISFIGLRLPKAEQGNEHVRHPFDSYHPGIEWEGYVTECELTAGSLIFNISDENSCYVYESYHACMGEMRFCRKCRVMGKAIPADSFLEPS